MSQNDVIFQLKRLIKSIESADKKWSRPDRKPTLVDLSEAIRTWRSDLERLGAFDAIHGVAYHAAQSAVMKAWNDRDNRDKAMAQVKTMVVSLKGIEGEMKAPEYRTLQERRAQKSLYGEFVAGYAGDPNDFGDLYQIRRQIAGFQAADGDFDPVILSRVKADLRAISQQYEPGTEVRHFADTAISALVQVDRVTPRAVKSMINQAAVAVDDMGHAISKKVAPTGYKAEITDMTAGDQLVPAIEKLQTTLYGYHFENPSTFLPRALREAKRVKAVVAEFFDPRANRIAGEIEDSLIAAAEASKDSAVKSMAYRGWEFQEVSAPFNVALNNIDMLDRHVRSQI